MRGVWRGTLLKGTKSQFGVVLHAVHSQLRLTRIYFMYYFILSYYATLYFTLYHKLWNMPSTGAVVIQSPLIVNGF